MKIHVRSKQAVVDETVRAHIERRIEHSLGWLSNCILRVTVQIIDLNGPRGVKDKSCRIEIRLLRTGTVIVEDMDADFYTAVDRAADRAAQSVARTIKGKQEFKRDAEPPSAPHMSDEQATTEIGFESETIYPKPVSYDEHTEACTELKKGGAT